MSYPATILIETGLISLTKFISTDILTDIILPVQGHRIVFLIKILYMPGYIYTQHYILALILTVSCLEFQIPSVICDHTGLTFTYEPCSLQPSQAHLLVH